MATFGSAFCTRSQQDFRPFLNLKMAEFSGFSVTATRK
jgi:hypothetical protein